ncbi:MAG: DUF5318 family protein [Frankia sp.]|nr:DUF5318 family protein [Frankia sp.]
MGPRSVVDYALARRATLRDLYSGRVSRLEVCDANPYLMRAARFHGEPTTKRCPVCGAGDPLTRSGDPLVHVTYSFGDELGESSGRCRATKELPALAARFRDVRIFVVEVCASCGWNHLVTAYSIGTGGPPARRARSRAADQ